MDSRQVVSPRPSGSGEIELRRVAGRTVATRLRSDSPLRLLVPRQNHAAWVFVGTYGGGLVAGDDIRLRVDCGSQTITLLGTQASTKVYRTVQRPCRQSLKATIETGAVLLSLPDPVACFAGSKYEQTQRFELSAGASLVALDWFTSGRHGRGERWQMHQLSSRTEVIRGNRCIFRDTLRLDPSDGPIDGAMRMGHCDVFATLLLIGPAVAGMAARIESFTKSRPIDDPILFGVSPLDAGIVLRVAGMHIERVARWIRDRLDGVSAMLGGDPWLRKW